MNELNITVNSKLQLLVTQIDPELCVHMHVMVLSDPYD